MSIKYVCDTCGGEAAPGTVTGGMPGGWRPHFTYSNQKGKSVCVKITHTCGCEDAEEPKQKPKPKKPRKRAPRKKG